MLNDKMLVEFLPIFKLGMIVSLGKESDIETDNERNELHRYQYINICQVSKT